MKRAWFLIAALIALVAPRDSHAQIEPPTVSASVQPRDVEVGEPFSVTLTVTVDSSAPSPSDPVLPLPEGLRTGPPSMSSQTQISIMNGHMIRKSGITATWQVVATREGGFGIGPPSVTWNGRKVKASAMRVIVHPASPGGHQRHATPSPNPFDPFGGMFPRFPGFFDTPQPEPQAEPTPDPDLALDAPLGATVFLRSVIDQKSPVVGEQVTFTVYLYARSMELRLAEYHEPSCADFFKRQLLSPDDLPESRPASVGGVVWRAQPIYKAALFPLRSGELEIGPLQTTIVGNSGRLNAARASQPIRLQVSEPPSKARPVGYQMGDVGNYTLTATVDPRKSEVGGAVAVTLKLAGVGNVPNAIKIPTSSALEWLEPQVREDLEVENGKVRGSRTFSYLVRPKTAGTVELGEATLPYWSPDRKVYDIARAYLGKIEVAPELNKSASADPAAPRDPWATLGKQRDRPGGYKRPAEPLTERPFYWLGLFGAPFAVVVSSLGSRGARRLRARYAAKRQSAERGIDQALSEARAAAKADQREAALGPLERGVYLAIERATGLKARALLIDDVPAALEAKGVPADLSADVKAVLGAIEVARFTPDGALSARELVDRADTVVRKLSRMGPIAKG